MKFVSGGNDFVFDEKKFVARETKLYFQIASSFSAKTILFSRRRSCFPKNKLYFRILNSFSAETILFSRRHGCFRQEQVCSPRNKIIFSDPEFVFGRNNFALPETYLFPARTSLFSEGTKLYFGSRARFWRKQFVLPETCLFLAKRVLVSWKQDYI